MTAESETPTEPGTESQGAAESSNAAPFQLLAQYIKDLSFEAPNTPQIFAAIQAKQPAINVNVDIRATKLQEETYEVVLQINAECKAEEKTAFLLEIEYAGVVHSALADDALKAVLLIEIPRLMFPFARNIVSDISRDGGFPPLMLSPMDFVAMYQRGQTTGAAEPADA
ncbi:MAG: protein-export chaperone SecB [Rhodospirillales bacterium]